MAFCTKCGTPLANDANFCGKCGTPVGAASGFVLVPEQTIVLNGKNCTIEGLIKISGEATIYKIKMDGKSFILKHYRFDMPLYDTTKEVLFRIKNNPLDRIIKIIDFGKYNNQDYEIMEFAEGETLREYLEKGAIRDVNQFKNIVRSINEGLQQVHNKHNVIYQDLKPDNIFFKDAGKIQIVLADFGVSSVMETGEKKATVAAITTKSYAAPELEPKTGQKYVVATPAADYYSLGITMFEMWLGEKPFKNVSPVESDYMLLEGKIDFPSDMPDDCKMLIRGLLKPDWRDRWGNEQVQQWLDGQAL
jgi:serine/threonine protein kinase